MVVRSRSQPGARVSTVMLSPSSLVSRRTTTAFSPVTRSAMRSSCLVNRRPDRWSTLVLLP